MWSFYALYIKKQVKRTEYRSLKRNVHIVTQSTQSYVSIYRYIRVIQCIADSLLLHNVKFSATVLQWTGHPISDFAVFDR